MYLLHVEGALDIFVSDKVVKVKVHAEYKHEYGDDQLDINALVAHAGIIDRKTAGSRCGKSSTDGIIKGHSAYKQKYHQSS